MENKAFDFESMTAEDKVGLAQALFETTQSFLTAKGHLTPNAGSPVTTGITIAKILCQAAAVACPFINGL